MAISREKGAFGSEMPIIFHIMKTRLPVRRSPASSPTGC
jgi:hypothetical protein